MGQGVHPPFPCCWPRLDADWSKVAVEQAPVDQAYAKPAFKMQATGRSSTIRGHWELRTTGAAARGCWWPPRARSGTSTPAS